MNAPAPRRGLPRLADTVIAIVALVLSSPLLVIAAIAIKLDSRGPVIYRQRRVGLGGAEFDLWKLRTMVTGSDPVGIGTAVTAADPRVTRIGRTLRRFSLDELPNLVNVVRGEMAIVGPRPTIPAQVELYSERQRLRLAVKPGLTGWAQVNGRVALGWDDRIELDVAYVERRSPRFDLQILARTLWLLITARGLTSGDEGLVVPEAWQRALAARERDESAAD
jgi:lipopolysaccharide/colanic/teichoic acid biosynthesis glycosyltransferase